MLKPLLRARVMAVCSLYALGVVLAPGCGPSDDGHGHDAQEESGAHDDHDEGAGGHDEHEGEEEEGVVHLTPAQIERSGVRVQAAGPGPIEEVLRVDAVVAENEDTQSHVNPRAAGLVKAIHRRLGDTVAKGDVLCEIDSVDLGEAVSAFQSARSTADAARDLRAKEVELFAARLATTTKVLDGAIALARTIRDREKDLESQGISTLRPLLEAEQALQEAELGREQQLTELGAERDSRLLELEAAQTTAEIAQHAAEDRLRILGVDPGAVRPHSERDDVSLGLYAVRAPRAGVIVARDATPDEFVDTGTTLFQIHDPSVAWITASVYERDLRRVHRGQLARVTVNALPGAAFEGRVGVIAFDVSPETRTTRVRVELPNEPVEQWAEPFPLRPGMFGSVEIVTAAHDVSIVLPEAALVHEGPESFVFVQAEPGEFHQRHVTVGARGRDSVEILSGLELGESVATEGTFVLKSAARAGELGGGHSH